MTSDSAASFSPDYATARARFLEAARAAGATTESFAINARGPHGEVLTIDEVRLGPERSHRAVIVSSGLHGVEGFAGSAMQLAWLSRVDRESLQNVSIVLVHAINPFGFAWRRRWNEHNVDLNRNFLIDRAFLNEASYQENRRVYDRLSPFLNPASPPPRWDPYVVRASLMAPREGLAALQRTLPVGQYHQPAGLFYGGAAPEETTALLRERLRVWTSGARQVLHLDIHTGLGRWGECQLLLADPSGSDGAAWIQQHLGQAVRGSDAAVAYRAHGTMTEDFTARALPCVYHGVTAEFGTYSALRVLGALRAENRAHHFGAPASAGSLRATRALLEAFAPRSSEWRRRVVGTGVGLITRAVDVSGGSDEV